jgi:hypothetical protein
VKINGSPIDEYRFQPGPATVTYTLEFEKAEARIAAGLSLESWEALPGTPEWIDPEHPQWSKCHILMWWRMHQRIPSVHQDIQNRELKRKTK